MVTTQTLAVNLPKLPEEAKHAFRMPNITNNLLTVAELCDAECTVTFSKIMLWWRRTASNSSE
eukprot:11144156-Ditylum_brightwellii.AAC.1